MASLRRTSLYPVYAKYGAKTIDFGGWELPVQFGGIQREHDAVRQRAGLFDVSHMGEFLVSGAGAESFLQRMTTNDLTRLELHQSQYGLLCYPNGGVVDDLLLYKLASDRFMLVVNAANIEKDWIWLEDHLDGDEVKLENVSDELSLLALQGPLAAEIMEKTACVPSVSELRAFRFHPDVSVGGVKAIVSRTGYTGEDGFELYVRHEDAIQLWELLMEAGQAYGLEPAGLGARDTLRFEARLPLYGQELSPDITPLEAGLGIFVKLDKGDFIGRGALAEQKANGLARKLVGIEMIDRGIPRTHYSVYAQDGTRIGEVTSGTQSPTFKRNVGLAMLDIGYTALDTWVWVDIRGKKLKAKVAATPFYRRAK